MTIISTSPRIWWNSGTLPALKAKAIPTNDRWQTLKDIADRPGSDWGDAGLEGYSLVYLVTGDPQYAAKAWTLMSASMASGLAEVTGDSGYPARSYFPGAATCLDWCWPALTATQRTQLIADLATNAAWVWPSTNPARAGAWSISDPGDNYWYGFLQTWLAGLSLYGIHPSAPGLVSDALNEWNTVALPYLNTTAAGGVMFEGTSYSVDSLGLLLWCLEAHSSATDQDLITPQIASGWCKDAITAMIHLTAPTLDRLAPLGDQTKSSGGSLQDAARLPMLIAASHGNLDALNWCQSTIPNRVQLRNNAWLEFAFGPVT
jgi:hypothetical protein